ncbi:MAG: hypothetical protein OI74_07935 [Gammaproteobacteria bacterium (ex Lamellibrachia satsuma)]|nr:MAG: hypothetical protein HPY30_04090 [Gammaproteobacteria bacterium (ex Lamellibrachia satsuma)]RRS33396.1 MAG: hypothetical protein OI74_07935 [Gammaproteobacteria bacterium (ex Lamellibrachia satsuma)]RRS35049.1 MAG: hypothetical protein NV67_11565 [Gammaproteobacteria bacterium (ex Lamellibrachia satsuma)]
MLGKLKSTLQIMGQGLAHQDLGEMSPTADKIAQIEKRSLNYRMSGGEGRVVLIASTDPMGPAFDFVVDLATKTNSLIEVLYFKPEEEITNQLRLLMHKMADLTHDFQITFAKCDLHKALSDYHKQRQDVIAVVSSASELFIDEFRLTPQALNPLMSINFPDILIVGSSFLA